MNILLKSGMSLNLATGQVFLTQDVSQDTSSVEVPVEESTTVTSEVTETSESTVDSTDTTNVEGDTTANEGEAGAEGTVGTEGETGLEGEATTEGEVLTDGAVDATEGSMEESDLAVDGGYTEDYTGMDTGMMGDMYGMTGTEGTEVKDPLLSNWFFVIGISVATLVVSVGLGILLAKKRIKKGIELYEN